MIMTTEIDAPERRREPGAMRRLAPEAEYHADIGGSPEAGPTGRGWFSAYDTGGFYDEMFARPGQPRPHYESLHASLSTFGQD
jgi:hypothetical protein